MGILRCKYISQVTTSYKNQYKIQTYTYSNLIFFSFPTTLPLTSFTPYYTTYFTTPDLLYYSLSHYHSLSILPTTLSLTSLPTYLQVTNEQPVGHQHLARPPRTDPLR